MDFVHVQVTVYMYLHCCRDSRVATPEEVSRVECRPDGADMARCLSRGCTWAPTSGPPGVPRCYLSPLVVLTKESN